MLLKPDAFNRKRKTSISIFSLGADGNLKGFDSTNVKFPA